MCIDAKMLKHCMPEISRKDISSVKMYWPVWGFSGSSRNDVKYDKITKKLTLVSASWSSQPVCFTQPKISNIGSTLNMRSFFGDWPSSLLGNFPLNFKESHSYMIVSSSHATMYAILFQFRLISYTSFSQPVDWFSAIKLSSLIESCSFSAEFWSWEGWYGRHRSTPGRGPRRGRAAPSRSSSTRCRSPTKTYWTSILEIPTCTEAKADHAWSWRRHKTEQGSVEKCVRMKQSVLISF